MEKIEISQYEFRVLNYIKNRGKVPENEIDIGEDERIIASSISYLESKNLINVEKKEIKRYYITDEGKKYMQEGFPEEQLYDLLKKENNVKIERVIALMGNRFKIAMANIAKLGLRPKNGLLSYIDNSPEAIFRENRALLNEIAESHATENRKIAELVKRGLVSEKANQLRTVKINEMGIQALNSYNDQDYLEILTPEILSSGSWNGKNFRPYDLNSYTEPVTGAGLHPLTYLIQNVRNIFLEMGFTEMRGHYIEYAGWNMDMLFIPQDHPARDIQDTFYINSDTGIEFENPEILKIVKKVHEMGYKNYSGWNYKWSEAEARRLLLRTHTTVNTIRYLYKNKDEPQFIFSIEKVFRHESVDWKHLSELYQIEGAVYSKDVSLSTLKWLLREFYSRLGFKNIRLVPSYYPYTEPSMDVVVDINGKEVEMGGSGIFRPEVTGPLGLKSPVLAFGLGLERLAMLYYSLNDIRDIYNSDIDWLRNYKIKF
ncbi:MAG: phenylalanine--tRNA ligase subunit alpha [Ferroplasma sp.]